MNKSHVSSVPMQKQLGADDDDEQSLLERMYAITAERYSRSTSSSASRKENT